MAIVQLGNNLSAGITAMKDRVVSNETSRSVERTITALYPDYLASLPAVGTPIDLPGMPLVKYRGYSLTQGATIGKLADYVLQYNQQEPDGGEAPPAPVLRESSSSTPRPWPEHPAFNADELWVYYDPDIGAMKSEAEVPADVRGRRYYIETDAEISYTEYFASDPGSVQAKLGTIEAPPGEGAAGAKWMIIAATRGREGRWWARTLVYGFNAAGWSVRDGKGAEA